MMHIFHEVASAVPPALKLKAANSTDENGNIKIPEDQNRPRYDPQILFSHPQFLCTINF